MQYNLEPVPEGLKIYVLRNAGGVSSALGHSHGTATIRGTFVQEHPDLIWQLESENSLKRLSRTFGDPPYLIRSGYFR